MAETCQHELQAMTLPQYKERARHLSRPTSTQTQAFVEHVAKAHRWYKKLPVISDGTGFSFYLSPDAGINARWDEMEGLKRKPPLPDDTPLHYSWKTTEQAIHEFAYLDYYRYRDSTVEENLPVSGSAWFSDEQVCLAVAHALQQKTFVECSAFLHPACRDLRRVFRLDNFHEACLEKMAPKPYSCEEKRLMEVLRGVVKIFIRQTSSKLNLPSLRILFASGNWPG